MIRWKRKFRWNFFFLFSLIFILILIRFRRKSCLIDQYRSKLFCFVLIDRENLLKQGEVLYQTWGKRCGHFTFIHRFDQNENSSLNLNYPIESFDELPAEEYKHLSEKIRQTLIYLGKVHRNYRWYFKGDHDTYLIVENLLRFLINDEQTNRIRSLLFGYRFREGHYVSGGAGYLLTEEALQLFNRFFINDQMYSHCNSSMEDMMIGECLQLALNLISSNEKENLRLIGETIDIDGRERFHPLPFRVHFNGPANKSKREWIHSRAFHHSLFGPDAISDSTISFHYTDPDDMYQMDSFIYQIKQFHQHICHDR